MIISYFENIQDEIIYELKKAKSSIHIAVAWFINKKIWQTLKEISKKPNDNFSKHGKDRIAIKVILVQDGINLNGNIDHEEMTNAGIEMIWDEHHHKFCIIAENSTDFQKILKLLIINIFSVYFRSKNYSKNVFELSG